MDLYYMENQTLGGGHPITKGASNFHLDDEIYYDMDIAPEVRVLATSYTPKVQRRARSPPKAARRTSTTSSRRCGLTRKEAEPYRAFVSIPGHLYKTFELPQLSRDPAARHRLGRQAAEPR